jgi:hypothetical protein
VYINLKPSGWLLGCSDFDHFLKIKIVHAFWIGIGTLRSNYYFFSSSFCKANFVFLFKKLQKPLLRAKIFFSRIGQYGCQKNPEFYIDFRSEEIIQKKNAPEKAFRNVSTRKYEICITKDDNRKYVFII